MTATKHRTVIVGASAAGLATADALRERGYQGRVVLVGDEPHLPYDRPPLSKQLLAGSQDFDFVCLSSAQHYADGGVDLRLGQTAVGLDPGAKTVLLRDGTQLAYDTLIVATGVVARQLPAAAGIANAITLRTYDDAVQLRDRLVESANVVIVGSGFIGLEVAATATKKGCSVDVVELAPAALHRRFPESLVDRIIAKHRAHGVGFHFGRVIERWCTSPSGDLDSIVLDDGTHLPADVAVVGIGTRPAVDWLAGSGLEIDNGVVCNEYGLAAPDIYAVGDVANWYHPLIGRHHRVEHRLSAGEQAQVVAARLTDTQPQELDLPFFWTDQYDDKWQLYGYADPDAELDIVVDDVAANRLVAVQRIDNGIGAVIGKNAARQLIPLRRDLKAAARAVHRSHLRREEPLHARHG